ncbi:carboxypeptidase-like regulatory domain-containing protein [Planctomicrobium piriforme]|uniref:carboxypeptidase-like regulatory domain-containing protein n=1 Tax=Planctomicrobium piriforme TaxID=1576369 RepID=UPI001FE6C1FC|nr:carboxypeptidase-like regulatory domain-containing protein [Planctomicrobium piriforme]
MSGVVTLDGQPLANADLLFQPAAGRPSTGQTDESGRYSLTYSAKATGAKVGDHQVRITTYRPNRDPKDPGSPEAPEKLPARYHSKTELTAQVKPGKNDKPFDLTSK